MTRADIERRKMSGAERGAREALASAGVQAIVDLRAERDRLAADLARVQEQYDRLNAEAGRCYALVMEYEGAVQVVPLDELMRARLDMLKGAEEHHKEHHEREDTARARIAELESDLAVSRCTGEESRREECARPSALVWFAWQWIEEWQLVGPDGVRASVWPSGTWHTWDENGLGGENASAPTVEQAMREAEQAVVRQGWDVPVDDDDEAATAPGEAQDDDAKGGDR